MILLLGAMVVGLAVALAPVWPYSRGRSWWPAFILLAILILVAGLLAIERIEAADDVQEPRSMLQGAALRSGSHRHEIRMAGSSRPTIRERSHWPTD